MRDNKSVNQITATNKQPAIHLFVMIEEAYISWKYPEAKRSDLMLKQPDRIVIYPQRDSRPDYLLCWIPPGNFSDVSGDSPETVSELEEYYPKGIETEFSQDGFNEFGINLPYNLEMLRQAYSTLSDAGIFAEVNFVDIKRLQDYVGKKDDPNIQELVDKFSNEEISLDDLKQNQIFKKLLKEPKSKGGEDPSEAFQKLSGQMKSSEE